MCICRCAHVGVYVGVSVGVSAGKMVKRNTDKGEQGSGTGAYMRLSSERVNAQLIGRITIYGHTIVFLPQQCVCWLVSV